MKHEPVKITVVGMGYVGLANAVLLARHNKVTALDIVKDKVDLINNGKSPVADAGIQEYLSGNRLDLKATNDARAAFDGADFIIVATPTNYDSEKNGFNTESVESVITDALAANPKAAIIVRSTVPVGYTESGRKKFGTANIIFCPEFLREGNALHDCLYPSRIVVGGTSEKARLFAGLLRKGARKKDIPVLFTDPSEAEAIKLFSNTYLAMRIAFFNELDSFAEIRGLDTKTIIDGVGLDPRIGAYYNNPSFGYGGYCLPKDTRQLHASYADVPQNIMAAIVEANRTRKEHIAGMILKRRPKTVGVYRLVMKTDSDNFRESAVLGVMERLIAEGIEIIVFEPALVDDFFLECRVYRDLEAFKLKADVILANRKCAELDDVDEKVYTRDVYSKD